MQICVPRKYVFVLCSGLRVVFRVCVLCVRGLRVVCSGPAWCVRGLRVVFGACVVCSGPACCVRGLRVVFGACVLCSGPACCVRGLRVVFGACVLCSGPAWCVQGLRGVFRVCVLCSGRPHRPVPVRLHQPAERRSQFPRRRHPTGRRPGCRGDAGGHDLTHRGGHAAEGWFKSAAATLRNLLKRRRRLSTLRVSFRAHILTPRTSGTSSPSSCSRSVPWQPEICS